MIDHISLVVGEIQRSKDFYAKALAPIGYSLQLEMPEERVAGFGVPSNPDFWIHGNFSSVTPAHVAFEVTSRLQVDGYHNAAIAAGGRDNGPPGLRPDYGENYYAAFVLDLDGHNIEAVCHQPE